jgi:hypothetical protein
MTLIDMNHTWTPPEGHTFLEASVRGAYILVTFHQDTFFPNSTEVNGFNRIVVYLNDQGREVLRVCNGTRYDKKPAVVLQPEKTFWEQLKKDVKDLFTGRL